MTVKNKPYQKYFNKISKTKEQIRVNHEYTKGDKLKDKLYKQFKELADAMIDSVQYKINHRGAYENAGQDEIREFMDGVSSEDFHYQQQCNLQDYINRRVDNLRYK